MDVTLNSSCSSDNDYIRLAPVSGKASILKSKIKPGVWTRTVAMAKDVKCKGSGKSNIKPGQTCAQYGSGGSGKGVIIQKTIAKDGGTTGVPYEQEIITVTGAMNG